MLRLILLAILSAIPATAADAPRPNIIFVLTDDLGWGDLGVLYQNSRNFASNRNLPAFVTPKLDTMAAQGARMHQHYCPAPVCAPSRASLLLGVHQGHANVRDNQFDKELADNHTLGTVLKQAGYATAAIGKWGVGGGSGFPAHPQNRGFDYFFGYMNHGAAHYHYPKEQERVFYENFTNIAADLDKCYSTDLITARSKKWISDQRQANPNQPFFLYLCFTAPHAQLNVPTGPYPAGGGISGGVQWQGTPGAMINTATGTIDTWIHPDFSSATWDHDNNPATAEQAWPAYARRHATMVRRLDDAMGDLFHLLADLGIDDNTLVVLSSDNGPHNEAGANGSFTQDPRFFRSYGPLDGIKRDVWEGGIRVPTLVRWPGGIPAGRVSTHPSQFHDWMKTFAHLAGLHAPFRSDGVSLVPDLTGTGSQREGVVYVEYYTSGTTPTYTDFHSSHRGTTRNQMQAIFHKGYKGVRYNVSSANTAFRVYDVANDPQETTNLAGRAGVPTTAELVARVAQVRRAGGGVSRVYDSVQIPPVSVATVKPGLRYSAYEGAFPWVPDFANMTPAASGETTGPTVSVRTRDSDIGLAFEGYLNVPADGTYTFYLDTDTAAFVRLHDIQLIDADFGYTAGGERSSGAVPLKAGRHPIRIHYRHANAASHSLNLRWEGPGIPRQLIPDANFFIEGQAAPSPPNAVPDEAFTTAGAPLNIAVLANDSDDGTPLPLFLESVTPPTFGSAVISGDQVLYTPPPGFLGSDSFSYTISDGLSSASAGVTVEVIPATSTIWLPFDETTGSTARDALGRPLGILAGFSTPDWVAGKQAGGLRFFQDGNADSVVLPGNKGITGTAARTVSFWIHANADQGSGIRPTLLSWGGSNSTTAGVRFDINLNHTSGYRLRGEFNSSGVNFTTPARSDLRAAGWVHCAIVVPQNATVSQILCYLDGVPASATIEPTGSGTTAINTALANDVTIGNWATDNGRPFRGMLDEVRIHSRALSAAEIGALAAQTPDQSAATAWFFRHSGNDFPADSDWNSDADHDGFSTFLEYAIGGNPTIPSQSVAPRLEGAELFVFNRRRSGLSVSAYRVEHSESLEPRSWSEIGHGEASPHPALADFDEVSVTIPESEFHRGFLRLKVSRP